MYCKKCGTEQRDGQEFCPKCGTPFVKKESSSNDASSQPTEAPFDVPSTEESTVHSPKTEKLSNTTQVSSSNTTMLKTIIVALSLLLLILLGVLIWKIIPFNDIKNVFASYESESTIDGIPFKSSEKGRWGMLKPDGTILFEDEFKDEPTVAREGRFMVHNGNGLWEIFTADEKPKKVGDEYVCLGSFYDGVAPAVKKNEHISLIDKDGNVIAVLEKSGSKPITKMENFHYGYALFEAGDAVGIVNTQGVILLEAKKYCKIYHVAPKRFLALDMRYKDEAEKQNLVFDIIDPVGNQEGKLRMAKYNDIVVLDDGYIGIEQTSDGEKLYGIMNLDGEIIVRPTNKMKGLYGYNDGKFIFSDGEYWGIRNVKDEVLIRAKYDAILWATSDLIWAISVEDGKTEMALVDLEGNKITSDTYQDALPFYDGKHAFVQITDKTWSMIDIDGNELKDVPDIYHISNNSADNVVVSDYLDIDAIISDINMTPNGFGGFGINMSAVNLVKAYNERCEADQRLDLNPSSVHTDKLSYSKEIMNGIELNVSLYYSMYITETGERHYDDTVGEWIQEPATWTKETPQYIRMSVSGSKLQGKTNLVYKKLAVKAKTYGKVYKENDHAVIVMGRSNKGIIIVDTGEEVLGMVKDTNSLMGENIEQYSEERTLRGSYVEAVDSDSIAIEDY